MKQNGRLCDLVEIINFTERISTRIHGIATETEIYRIIREESEKSTYIVAILLLRDDKKVLEIVEAPLPSQKLKAAEKTAGLTIKGYAIDLNKSHTCNQVIHEGETVHVTVDSVVKELFPPPVAQSILEILGSTNKYSILTPLKRDEEIIGAVAVTSPEMAEHFIPSVRNLAKHISTALELSSIHREHMRIEKEKDRILNTLEKRVRELYLLYKIDEIFKKKTEIGEILKEIVQLIPSSGQYPESTGSRITLEDHTITENFSETPWILRAPIRVQEKEVGTVEMCYLEEKPFLDEEKKLLDSVAGRLGEFLERKQTEKSLRMAEKKFRDIFDYANDAVFIHEMEGHFLEVNRTACERLGYTREELLELTPMEIDAPEYSKLVPDRIEELKRKGSLFFETVHVTKDGKKIPIELNSRTIEFEGKPAILSIARDITERIQTEEALQQSEFCYRTLFENMPIGIGITTPDGRTLACNDALARMTGYSKAELEQINVRDTYQNPEERDLLLKKMQETGAVHDFEVGLKHRDGSPYWATLTVASGVLAGREVLLIMARDITEQKLAEQKLRESEEKYRDLVENIHDVIYVINENGVLTYVSPAIESVLGYTALEAAGHSFQEFIYEEDLPSVRKNFQATLSGQTTANEYRIMTKSGKPLWMRTSSRPLFTEGHVSGVQGVIVDVSELKRVEDELKYRLDFEEIITAISTYFINLAPDEVDQGIQLALEKIGKFTEVDRCDVFLLHDNYTKMSNTHEWCAEGIESEKDRLQGLDVRTFEWGINELKKLEVLNIPHVLNLQEGADKEALQNEGIQSLLCVPIFIGGVLFGFIVLESLRTERTWSDDVISMLKIAAEIFANALERKRSEEALRESEQQYHSTIDSMGNAIHVVDSNLRIIFFNKFLEKWVRGIGLTTDVVGRNIFEAFPFLPDRIRDEYDQVFSTGKTLITEETTLIEGRKFVTDTRKIPVFEEGKVQRVVTVVDDITERKKSEDKLRESEEKFRGIAERNFDAIFELDSEGHVLYISPAVQRITGYAPDEICGKWVMNFIHEERKREFGHVLANLAKGETIEGLQMEVKGKNGSLVIIEFNASPVIKDGKVIGVQGVVRDITERKRAEERIRTSLREKEVLLREIHHRVKNNLQVVSSLLNLQSEHIKDTLYTEMLKESQNRIRTMSLIHEKLYQSENVADIDFTEYIQSLVNGLLRSYKAERVTVTVDVGDVSLNMDAAIPCGLIINELVSNSLKHAFPDKRTGEIVVTLYADRGFNTLVIRDNGIGIPDSVDFRDTDTLGLDLVITLAEEQLKGTITLDKRGGTLFKITFPQVI